PTFRHSTFRSLFPYPAFGMVLPGTRTAHLRSKPDWLGGLPLGHGICRRICRASLVRHLVDIPAQSFDRLMNVSPGLIFSLLLTLAFVASTILQPRAVAWTNGHGSDHLLQVLLGDGRELLANHLFVKADVYFHSGYYPSIFDAQHTPTNSQHMVEAESGHHDH